jgi:hypothetical protein
LVEVELCEGLVEIGNYSFDYCDHSITRINIPASLRRIQDSAFRGSLQTPIRLHDGIGSVGDGAFAFCIFTNFRIPPLITSILEGMLYQGRSMFSLELTDNMRQIKDNAFYNCFCLRNAAFPSNAVFGDNIFIEEEEDELDIRTDLQLLFGNSDARIIRKLQHRFDGLLIHRIVYYQSYHQDVLQMLIAAINLRSDQRLRRKLDPTGNKQDCLGMTPLHILTCSSVHNLEVYRVIIEKYPENLITEDRWGELPLLYAFWGAAPGEIIQFLLDSYQLYYPGHVFNWTMMVETIGRCNTHRENIERLLHVKQTLFTEQPIDWDHLLDKFASPSYIPFSELFKERMKFLFLCGLSTRVEALAFKVWRDCIFSMIQTADFKWAADDFKWAKVDNYSILHGIRRRIAQFDDELPKLKEATTMLELAFWKLKINDILPGEATNCQNNIKTDEWSIRQQCRVACGADIVIGHVLPFLTAVADEESDSYVESDSDSTSDDGSSDSM